MQYAGYAHLINQDNITALAPAISVEVRPVTRKETIGQTIAVPAKLAPAPDDRLGHVLFAIKHEGINLLKSKNDNQENTRKIQPQPLTPSSSPFLFSFRPEALPFDGCGRIAQSLYY